MLCRQTLPLSSKLARYLPTYLNRQALGLVFVFARKQTSDSGYYVCRPASWRQQVDRHGVAAVTITTRSRSAESAKRGAGGLSTMLCWSSMNIAAKRACSLLRERNGPRRALLASLATCWLFAHFTSVWGERCARAVVFRVASVPALNFEFILRKNVKLLNIKTWSTAVSELKFSA